MTDDLQPNSGSSCDAKDHSAGRVASAPPPLADQASTVSSVSSSSSNVQEGGGYQMVLLSPPPTTTMTTTTTTLSMISNSPHPWNGTSGGAVLRPAAGLSSLLRHDEQVDEAHYDDREGADDDLEKGKIRFPQHTLFGRTFESQTLNDMLTTAGPESKGGSRFKVALLEGPSGVGKSALVWETLLYQSDDENDSDGDRQTSKSTRRKRRSCWIASGKYNHKSTSQEPFNAVVQSLEQLATCIATEAKTMLHGDGTVSSRAEHEDSVIVALSHRLESWYDSDDASMLMAFCGSSMETMHATLKKLHEKFSKKSNTAAARYHRPRNRQHRGGGNRTKSPKPPFLKCGSSSGKGEASESSSVFSDDTSSLSATDRSLLASNDIQQVALALHVFLQYLTSPTRPLIWFLDDLQWADVCSLQLLETFLTRATSDSANDNDTANDKEWTVLEMDVVDMAGHHEQQRSIHGIFVGAYRPLPSWSAMESSVEDSACTVDVSNGSHEDPTISDMKREPLPLENFLERINNDVGEESGAAEGARSSLLKLQVSNLSPKAILDFCCATLDMPEEEAWPLTNALYSATMGNIFHCRQALEHLVRSNCLYYDVMFFSWTYNLPDDGSALQDIVAESCQDVLGLVRSKLQSCSSLVRDLLIRAAFTENTVFGAMLLLALLQATGYPELTIAQLQRTLEEAIHEGLLLNITYEVFNKDERDDGMDRCPFHMLHYKFSHDKVKEATYRLLPESGPQRDGVLLPLATVLIQWASQSPSSPLPDPQPSDGGLSGIPYSVEKPRGITGNLDWMWFVGVQHLNSLPMESLIGTSSASFKVSTNMVLPSIEINRMRLAQWNFHVAEMSVSRSSYNQAIEFLKAAIAYLDPDEMWSPDGKGYGLALKLYNKLMEISFAQGHYDEAKSALSMVLAKATRLQDKIAAFHTKVLLAVELNDRNQEFGIAESLSILKLFGMRFPSQPTSIDTGLESMKLKMELQGRPLSVLAELDLIPPDDPKGDTMKLLVQLVHMILLAKKPHLSLLIEVAGMRGMRWTLENGISRHFALLLTECSTPFRRKGKIQAAGKYASIVKRLFQRFADEGGSDTLRSSDFLFCEFILHAGMLPLRNHPFCESLEKFLQIYRYSLANGTVEYAMSSAMHYPLVYFVSGRPLNALLEAKLVLFQDKAKQLHLHSFEALFHCALQVLHNLQGKAHWVGASRISNTTEIQGEQAILAKMEGSTKKMTTRDFAMYQMMLAVIFYDLDCMEVLLDRLEDTPLFDLSFARQQLRMTFCGIAALLVAREGRNAKKNLKVASDVMKELKKLDGAVGSLDSGSVNFRPIILCLTAVERHKIEDYDAAIAMCNRLQLYHLKALMCEMCGRLCMELSHAEQAKHPRCTGRGTALFKKGSRKPGPKTHEAAPKQMDTSTTEVVVSELAKSYLGKAMWLYQNWNALAKVSQLKEEFPYLKTLTRRAAGISKSSTSSVGSGISYGSANNQSQTTGFSTYFPSESQLGRSSENESIHSGDS